MAKECKYPGCDREEYKDGHCLYHLTLEESSAEEKREKRVLIRSKDLSNYHIDGYNLQKYTIRNCDNRMESYPIIIKNCNIDQLIISNSQLGNSITVSDSTIKRLLILSSDISNKFEIISNTKIELVEIRDNPYITLDIHNSQANGFMLSNSKMNLDVNNVKMLNSFITNCGFVGICNFRNLFVTNTLRLRNCEVPQDVPPIYTGFSGTIQKLELINIFWRGNWNFTNLSTDYMVLQEFQNEIHDINIAQCNIGNLKLKKVLCSKLILTEGRLSHFSPVNINIQDDFTIKNTKFSNPKTSENIYRVQKHICERNGNNTGADTAYKKELEAKYNHEDQTKYQLRSKAQIFCLRIIHFFMSNPLHNIQAWISIVLWNTLILLLFPNMVNIIRARVWSWFEVGNDLIYRLYFSIITATTLGYGDVYPVSTWGRILTSIEAFLGMIFISMFIIALTRKYLRN
ncbi:two pore domain potassium channel family protein [bacterium]|nr:two pore domain potassium channel family protein [bacterium]